MANNRVLDAADVVDWLASDPEFRTRLGGAVADWRLDEQGESERNSLFLVKGPSGALRVKQALPYLRVGREGGGLDLERARYEAAYFERVAPFVGELAASVYRFNPDLRLIVTEGFAPADVLRDGLIAGRRSPRLVSDMAEYLAETSVRTSDLAAPFETRARDIQLYSQNLGLQRFSVDALFAEPFALGERHRLPAALAPWAAALKGDVAVRSAVARLRIAYLTKAQSLLHGALSADAIVATPEKTKVFDAEFAWVGPSGFDVGSFLADLAIAWFAKPFHPESAQTGFREALEADIVDFWRRFRLRFLEVAASVADKGEAMPSVHFGDPVGSTRRTVLQKAYVDDVLQDAVGFLALNVIRRTLGEKPAADFLAIADPSAQALAKARSLAFARALLIEPQAYRYAADFPVALREFGAAGLPPDPSARTRA